MFLSFPNLFGKLFLSNKKLKLLKHENVVVNFIQFIYQNDNDLRIDGHHFLT